MCSKVYGMVTIPADSIFNEAMEKGHVKVRINSVLLFGMAGTGKTCTRNLILGKRPPDVRSSTPVAESPKQIHVELRDMSKTTVKVGDHKSSWEEVDLDKLKELTAGFLRKKYHHIPEDLEPKMKKLSGGEMNAPQTSDYLSNVTDLVEELQSKTSKEFDSEILSINWVYLIDSGGQPHFQNLLPLFMSGVSTAVYVFRLIDRPYEYPEIQYYKEGKLLDKSWCSSPLNNAKNFSFLVQSIESFSNDCRLVCIGTHWDIANEEQKTEYHRVFFEQLPKKFRESEKCVYKNGELIIPVNAVIEDEPDINEYKRSESTAELQDILWPPTPKYKECIFREIKVPAWWYFFKISLKTSFNNRKVLSLEECKNVAHSLKFHEDAMIKALNFFHEHHIVYYYPSILPNLVFCDPQLLLDIVTKVVELAKVPNETSDGSMLRLINEGIVTLQTLCNERLEEYFTEGLFEPKHLVKLFKHLLIWAEIDDSNLEMDDSKKEYLMPAILESIHEPSEFVNYQLSSSSAAPLLVCFKSGFIKCGVFCCLQVFLIKNGWVVSSKLKPKQNCVKLNLRKRSCSVTLINHFSYIAIYVNAFDLFGYDVCPRVTEQILKGIKESYEKLGYGSDIDTELAFYCLRDVSPEESFTNPLCKSETRQPKSHIATVDDRRSHMICTKYEDHYAMLQRKHMYWFDQVNVQDDSDESVGSAYKRSVHFVWDHLMLYKLTDKELSYINGKGIAIAILDTGVNPDHMAIKDNIVLLDGQTKDSITNQKNWSHGTSVAGVAVGKHLKRSECALLTEREIKFKPNKILRIGVAPEASLVVFKVTNDGEHYQADKVIDALEKIKTYNDSGNSLKVKVIVMPFQLFFEGEDGRMEELFEELKSKDVLCLASAGNQGLSTGLGYPATSEHVLTIGASTKYSRIADFSSQPIADRDNKDIVSILGDGILAPVITKGDHWTGLPSFHYPEDRGKAIRDCLLERVKGTSYSAPAIAGLVAIILQLNEKIEIGLDLSKNVVTRWKLFFENNMFMKLDPSHRVIIPKIVKEFLCDKIKHVPPPP